MKKLVEILQAKLGPRPSTWREFFSALGDFNAAWHTGKALTHIHMTMDEMNEDGDDNRMLDTINSRFGTHVTAQMLRSGKSTRPEAHRLAKLKASK
jgi:hypothetical protein